MNAATAPFVLGICIVGAMGLAPLMAAFGLIGILRKLIDWIESHG